MKLAVGAAVVSLIALTASAQTDGGGAESGLSGAESLGPFFNRLDGARDVDGSINILFIGDSHAAGDNVSGGWRELLQARYGAGGRGAMMPGRPFGGYITRGVTVEQSPGWTTQSIFDPAIRDGLAHPLFSASGWRQTATAPGARMAMLADTPDFSFTRFVVCAVSGPGQGGYALRLGDVVTHVSLDAPQTRLDCHQALADQRQSQAEVDVESGPVTITSWGGYAGGGVTVSNFGVVGTQIKNLEAEDDGAIAEELRAYQPDLIVIEFGTNDGFVGHFDPRDYELGLRRQIARYQRLSPVHAPILLLGAPDADTDRAELAANAPAAEGAPRPGPGFWYPPPALAAVREIQRRVARSMGVAFWDWSARMGGPGMADRWANADPPLMRKDRVHYNVAGGRRIAGLLDADLEAAKAADLLSAR
jgi:lysophospholipase L1-like esterase